MDGKSLQILEEEHVVLRETLLIRDNLSIVENSTNNESLDKSISPEDKRATAEAQTPNPKNLAHTFTLELSLSPRSLELLSKAGMNK
jgi:hypothetical protein